MSSAIQQALSGDPASARKALQKIAAQGKQSDDPIVRQAASAAEHVLKGLDLLEKDPKKDHLATFKAVLEFGMAGPDVLQAGLEGLKKYGGLDADTTKLLNQMLGGGTSLIKALSSACQAMDHLANGRLGEGIKAAAELGESAFKSMRWILERNGTDPKKLDAIEKVLAGGKAAVDKVVKGLDYLDKKEYGKGIGELANAGGDVLQAVAPLLADKAGEYAKFFGPLARSAGNIAAAAPEIATLMDQDKSYLDRLNAAQKVFATLGTEAVRGLGTAAFGDKAGNALADAIQSVANKTIAYDQETGCIAQEAQTMLDRAWNKEIHNGEFIARLMGHRKDMTGMTEQERQVNQALANFPEFWASANAKTGQARKGIFNTLAKHGPEAALSSYLSYLKKFEGRQSMQVQLPPTD